MQDGELVDARRLQLVLRHHLGAQGQDLKGQRKERGQETSVMKLSIIGSCVEECAWTYVHSSFGNTYSSVFIVF